MKIKIVILIGLIGSTCGCKSHPLTGANGPASDSSGGFFSSFANGRDPSSSSSSSDFYPTDLGPVSEKR